MTGESLPDPSQQTLPFNDVLGPAQATGHLAPNVQVGVGLTVNQGAFPAGQDLEVMERLSPGAVGRIITMSETAQRAQIDAAIRAHNYARADTRRGHWLGASLTTLAIIVGAAVGTWGNPVVAVAILGVPVFTAISRFVDSVRGK